MLWRRCAAAVAVAATVVVVVVVLRGRTSKPVAPAVTLPSGEAQRAPEPPKLDVVPAPAITVRVTANGAPAADALVALTDGSRPVLVQAHTDREGRVRFDDLPRGPYELWASGDALASAPLRLETAADVELALEPAANVRGEVQADGFLSFATVALVPLDGDHATRIASVDAAGRFAIDGVPHGRWRVESAAPGYAQASDAIVRVAEREQAIAVRIAKTGSVSGTVVDGSGAPVANATIVLRDQAGASPQRPLALAATGLRWVHPLAGTRQMPANQSGRFMAVRPGARPSECGRGHCGIDIGSVRGTIVHASADGEVASIFAESRTEAGKVVAIHHGGGLKSFYMHLDEIRPGLEVGQSIKAGEPVGTLGSTGFVRSIPHVHFAITHEHRGRTWYLDPEPVLRHAVVLPAPRAYEPFEPSTTKDPLPAQPVVQRVTTDAQGRFVVDGIAPGTYVAGAFATDYAPGASAAFAIASGQDTSGIVVRLDAGIALRGVVVGRDGPLAGARVMAGAGFGETAHKIATTYTDNAGRFTLRALAGKVTVTVQAPTYGELERVLTVTEATREQTFQLVIENARLRGQVLAPDGGAAAGVTVRIVDGPTRKRTVTDAQGNWVINGVATGNYVVELASAEFPAKRADVVPEVWREIRLDAGGGMRVVARDGAGAPLAAKLELVGPSGQTLTKQPGEIRGLVPGAWKVTARAAGHTPQTKTVAIRAARVLEDVAFDLARSATVAGTVRDRHGRRVAGARVSIGAATATTDADGNFVIRDAPAGAAAIEAELDGARGTLPIELQPGAERAALTVELQ